MALSCPVCHCDLGELDDGGVLVDRCPNCAGVWLDGNELTRLIEGRGRSFAPEVVQQLREKLSAGRKGYQHGPREAADRPCPRCGGTLRSFNYAYSTGVIVDRCPACKGVWTDYGEIEQIEILMSQGGEWKELVDTTLDNCPSSPFQESLGDKLASLGTGRYRYGGFYWFLRLFE